MPTNCLANEQHQMRAVIMDIATCRNCGDIFFHLAQRRFGIHLYRCHRGFIISYPLRHLRGKTYISLWRATRSTSYQWWLNIIVFRCVRCVAISEFIHSASRIVATDYLPTIHVKNEGKTDESEIDTNRWVQSRQREGRIDELRESGTFFEDNVKIMNRKWNNGYNIFIHTSDHCWSHIHLRKVPVE